MSSPLDRIEAQVQEEIGHRVSGGMYRTEDVLALVNVAKAAEQIIGAHESRHPSARYWTLNEKQALGALREALAVLKQERA